MYGISWPASQAGHWFMKFVCWLMSHSIWKSEVTTRLKLLCQHSPITVWGKGGGGLQSRESPRHVLLGEVPKKGFTEHNIYVLKHRDAVIILMLLPDYDKLYCSCQGVAQNFEKWLLVLSSYVYWTVHHCDSWRIKDQLDATCCFISLLLCSTCFGH